MIPHPATPLLLLLRKGRANGDWAPSHHHKLVVLPHAGTLSHHHLLRPEGRGASKNEAHLPPLWVDQSRMGSHMKTPPKRQSLLMRLVVVRRPGLSSSYLDIYRARQGDRLSHYQRAKSWERALRIYVLDKHNTMRVLPRIASLCKDGWQKAGLPLPSLYRAHTLIVKVGKKPLRRTSRRL